MLVFSMLVFSMVIKLRYDVFAFVHTLFVKYVFSCAFKLASTIIFKIGSVSVSVSVSVYVSGSGSCFD